MPDGGGAGLLNWVSSEILAQETQGPEPRAHICEFYHHLAPSEAGGEGEQPADVCVVTVYLAPLCTGHPGKCFKYRVSSTPAFLQCGHDGPHFADELREGQGLAQGDPESMGGVFQPQGRGAAGVQSRSGFQKLTPGHSTRCSDRWMVGKPSVAGKRMNNSRMD